MAIDAQSQTHHNTVNRSEKTSPKVGVVVVAAGRGTRMGTSVSKQYLLLQNKPIVVHTLEVFEHHPSVAEIVLVTGEHDVGQCTAWVNEYGIKKCTQVIAGGAERQYSVYQGLLRIEAPWVLIHDGVRPFVTHKQIASCIEAALEYGASTLAVPVKDTVKRANSEGLVLDTLQRSSLWAIQTPQACRRSELIKAHEQANAEGYVGTDDAMLLERRKMAVKVVQGEYSNIKITTPDDLDYAEWLCNKKDMGERNS